ncbi:MAG TPA: pyruvate formate lyase family protein, partial [Vicinamibacterales bacterium]
GHTVLDGKIYTRGLIDFQGDIDAAMASIDTLHDPEAWAKGEQLTAMRIACDAVIRFAERHAEDAEALAVAAELQLLDRSREHVLDDHQPGVGRDDQPLWRDQPVSDVPCVLVEQREGGHQLPYEADSRIGIQLEPAFVRDPQDVGQPGALDVIRYDRQAGRGHLYPIHATNARVIRVPEICQPRGPLAQRELERGNGGERRFDAQNLQQFAGGAIGSDHPIADTVAEQGSLWPFT